MANGEKTFDCWLSTLDKTHKHETDTHSAYPYLLRPPSSGAADDKCH